MQVGRVDEGVLRRLAEYDSGGAPVVSVYLNLDPAEFALAEARSTAVRSLVDDAHRRIERQEGLDHAQRATGLKAVERVRDWFGRPDFSADGAHALGVFCAGDDGLFEAVKLPRPVPSEVIVGRKPFVEPLVDMAGGGAWCVLVASREAARVFRGSVHRLDAVASIGERPARGQHDQGGWSQARYERSVGEDVAAHLKRTAELLFRRYKRAPFDRVLIGATAELAPRLEERLHPELRGRLVGRIDVDAEHATADDVLSAARPAMQEEDRRADEEALERLRERASSGRGAIGLEDTLEALTERRVETLLIQERFSAAGVMCPRCGWLGPGGAGSCPADGTATQGRDDIADLAIERALGQSAEVRVPGDGDALRELGGIAAVLRF